MQNQGLVLLIAEVAYGIIQAFIGNLISISYRLYLYQPSLA